MHYLVGNKYEGCGHQHKSLRAALNCFDRMGNLRYSIYRLEKTEKPLRLFYIRGKEAVLKFLSPDGQPASRSEMNHFSDWVYRKKIQEYK